MPKQPQTRASSGPKSLAFVALARLLVTALVVITIAGCERSETTSPSNASSTPADSMQRTFAQSSAANLSEVQAHKAAIRSSWERGEAALPLENLAADAARVQTLALAHEVLKKPVVTSPDKMRLEVFSVYRLRESDLRPEAAGSSLLQPEERALCQPSSDGVTPDCWRIDLYDFPGQRTIYGVVDLKAERVLSWNTRPGLQPEVPERLRQIAIAIASNAPEVREALGGTEPNPQAAQMANTKTSLKGTRCERSQHLCVAPTFVQGNIAIWAIVDLTALELVGVQWTEHGQPPEADLALAVPTEQSLADSVIMAKYCERNQVLERDGWSLQYMLTASDGLQISEVSFQGKPVLISAKLVDWHVNYSERDAFGYADAVGCPNFSSAAVIPYQEPKVLELPKSDKTVIEGGFRLEQEFRSAGWPGACNYSYRQAFEFYKDGSFRPTAASIGAGCGNDGTYRPLLRIEPAGSAWQVDVFDGKNFVAQQNESWLPANGAVDGEGTRIILRNLEGGFALKPGRGQFANSRGDFEFIYLTRGGRPDEGQLDLPTLGSCCNTNHEQGPETFINAPPEPLASALVLWYVPQMKNDLTAGSEYCFATRAIVDGISQIRTFPCESGPLFVPLRQPAIAQVSAP